MLLLCILSNMLHSILMLVALTIWALIIWSLRLYQMLRLLKPFPKRYAIISASAVVNRFLPTIPGLLLGIDYSWAKKSSVYNGTKWNVHVTVAIGSCRSALWIADTETIREVCSSRKRFPKGVEHYNVLLVFGPNMISAADSDWKRFRKISATAFSETNNALVWKCTTEIIQNTVIDQWKEQSAIHVSIQDLTHKISLSVMAAAGMC
ncbi:hypothetical protein J3R30DRAFT_2595853 [Lentinula aciculospora]|uniref:Cytochrome P450 n=1 Tax=Lentinula aciculospora TaxID=153920 RepID=A0A9W9ADL5_9AGAR|nr:hypothetical protein J3R30DRAFT_2595853 [Lentinula aciculospora]